VNRRQGLALAGIAALVAAVVATVVARRHRAATAKKDDRPPIALAVSAVPPEPSIWVDVHAPAKVWRSLRANPWMQRALAEPLGQGAGAEWAGFLSTKGGDLADAFQGVVLDLFADKLLAEPFRVVFFTGPDATGAPAFVVPRPVGTTLDAFDLLEGVARNGGYLTERCPGTEPKDGLPASPIAVSRWLVAEQALFAGKRDGRIALARNPVAVVQALCAAPPDVPAAQGVDLSLSFSRDALGREAQLGAALLGLGPATRLAFAVEGDTLQPRGLLGALDVPGRLAAAPPPEALLKVVPADAGVVMVATLRLPEKLTRETLAAHLRNAYSGGYAPRPVALVWNPRGVGKLPTEVAVAWPDRDRALLEDAFTGPNRMERRRACGQVIYASTGALATAMQKACDGKAPSILNAAPAVAGGLRAETSLGLGVNLGPVLSRLLREAYAEDATSPHPPQVPEIEAARRLLEELPYVGLRGVAKDGALVPGGFRS
jgi:hypothetical protein